MRLLLPALAAIGAFTLVPLFHASDGDSITRSYAAGDCGKGACWTCDSAVNLKSVTISIETNAVREDGVKLGPGCTGTIDSLNVTTQSADGVKAAEGAHDLTINGGSVTCTDKAETLHQDAVQVMGGSNLTFRNLRLDCGRADVSLIDSNFFVNEAGSSTTPPSDVICAHCYLGPEAAHTANIEASKRSGLRNSTICPGKFPKLTLTIGSEAINPVNKDNVFPASC